MKAHRIQKVGSEMRHVVAETIRDDLSDPRISGLTSITRVEVSADLEWAKVYVSVFGDPREQRDTINALKRATGRVQYKVSRKMSIRQCPHIIFVLDESLKKSQEVMKLIDESMQEIDQDHADQEDHVA